MLKISFWYIFMGILSFAFFFNFYINWREFKRLQYGAIPEDLKPVINEQLYKEISLRESEEFNGHFWTSFFRFTSLTVIFGFELVPKAWKWFEAFGKAKFPDNTHQKVGLHPCSISYYFLSIFFPLYLYWHLELSTSL